MNIMGGCVGFGNDCHLFQKEGKSNLEVITELLLKTVETPSLALVVKWPHV